MRRGPRCAVYPAPSRAKHDARTDRLAGCRGRGLRVLVAGVEDRIFHWRDGERRGRRGRDVSRVPVVRPESEAACESRLTRNRADGGVVPQRLIDHRLGGNGQRVELLHGSLPGALTACSDPALSAGFALPPKDKSPGHGLRNSAQEASLVGDDDPDRLGQDN